jgi:MoaA/NifB/PqqE/SkfB family radical SAM enzyme
MKHLRRLLGLGGRILASNVRRSPLPLKLTFILTYRCDCRCQMCNIWKRKVEEEMTAEEVERFFRTNRGFPWVNLSGGEIFTRPDLLDIASSVVRTNPDLYLLDFPTTGQMTEKIVAGVERILALDPPKLLVTCSLDGAGLQHDAIRRRKNAFENVIATYRALRRLSAKNLNVFFGVTLSNFNQGDLFRIYDSVKERLPWITYRDFHVNLAQESAHYYQNQGLGLPREDEALKDMEEFLRRKGPNLHPVGWLESRYQQLLRRFYRLGRSPLPCQALASSLFIDPHWVVYPCSMWDVPLGCLRDTGFDLRPIWNAAETLEARRKIREEQCPHCWTPCEAYQTIAGNLPRALVTR